MLWSILSLSLTIIQPVSEEMRLEIVIRVGIEIRIVDGHDRSLFKKAHFKRNLNFDHSGFRLSFLKTILSLIFLRTRHILVLNSCSVFQISDFSSSILSFIITDSTCIQHRIIASICRTVHLDWLPLIKVTWQPSTAQAVAKLWMESKKNHSCYYANSKWFRTHPSLLKELKNIRGRLTCCMLFLLCHLEAVHI